MTREEAKSKLYYRTKNELLDTFVDEVYDDFEKELNDLKNKKIKMWLIVAEKDKVYPEIIWIGFDRKAAERKFVRIAGDRKIEKYGRNKWFNKDYDTYVLTYKFINTKNFL